MTLVNDPFNQSCRSKIFRSLHDQSIFLATSFRVSNASIQKYLIIVLLDHAQYYQGFLYLRYSGLFSGISMYAAHQKFYCRLFIKDNIMPCRILYLWISALRNSIDFISLGSQFDLSIIDYLSPLDIIQNGVLTAYLHKQTSDQYHYGTVR